MSEEEEEVQPQEENEEDPDARSVFVGNVHFNSTKEELAELFSDCNEIKRITIIHGHDGFPKGYAYIEFTNKTGMETALEYNESTFKGRNITVCPKRKNIPMSRQRGRRYMARGSYYYQPRRRLRRRGWV